MPDQALKTVAHLSSPVRICKVVPYGQGSYESLSQIFNQGSRTLYAKTYLLLEVSTDGLSPSHFWINLPVALKVSCYISHQQIDFSLSGDVVGTDSAMKCLFIEVRSSELLRFWHDIIEIHILWTDFFTELLAPMNGYQWPGDDIAPYGRCPSADEEEEELEPDTGSRRLIGNVSAVVYITDCSQLVICIRYSLLQPNKLQTSTATCPLCLNWRNPALVQQQHPRSILSPVVGTTRTNTKSDSGTGLPVKQC